MRRQLARWRLATGLLAALCLGLGSVMAYRTWFRPDDGHWVAVLRAEDAGHAVALRIDPASGTFHVRAFAPEPAAGETYRLWLVTKGRGALLLGTFATGLSDRAPALARMGIGALRTSEAVITREPLVRAPTAGASPGENVVYRGRLAPD